VGQADTLFVAKTTIHDGNITGAGKVVVSDDATIDSTAAIDIAAITVDDTKTRTLNDVTVSGTAIADHSTASGDGIVVVQQTVTLKAGASIDGGDITIDPAAILLVSDGDTTSTSATLSNDEVTNN